MKRVLVLLAVLWLGVNANAQMKIAHVNSQSLLDSLPSYLKAENDLKNSKKMA